MQLNKWLGKAILQTGLLRSIPLSTTWSIEMLAFNFVSKTFAYRSLAQGLSRALSTFSSFIREYLVKVTKADQCAQYVDDIGIADAEQPLNKLSAAFQCIQKSETYNA